MPDNAIKVPEEPEFESSLKGLKWEDMDIVQKVQAKLSQGKEAEKFQAMEMKASQKDMTKAATPGTNMGNEGGLEKRVPEELQMGNLTYNTNYIMNHLGLKEDKRKKKEDDPMSVYDSSLMSGPSIKDKVHNHVKGRLKEGKDETVETETNNSGEAHSLDYAVRNIEGMKRHRKATNIGKRMPGCKKATFEDIKDEIKVAYFLAGLMKTAGDHLPDFEDNPDLFLSFLHGFCKEAGPLDAVGQAMSRFLNRSTDAMPSFPALDAMAKKTATPPSGMSQRQTPVQPLEAAKQQHISGGMPVTRAGALAAAQR